MPATAGIFLSREQAGVFCPPLVFYLIRGQSTIWSTHRFTEIFTDFLMRRHKRIFIFEGYRNHQFFGDPREALRVILERSEESRIRRRTDLRKAPAFAGVAPWLRVQ